MRQNTKTMLKITLLCLFCLGAMGLLAYLYNGGMA